MPTKTRVYGPSWRRWPTAGRLGLVTAAWLGWALVSPGHPGAEPDLDCARPAEARTLIGRLQLSDIEGAEDIHRAAMWDAFGRCPAGAAGEPCRTAERRRFEAQWDRQKREIEARYRAMLAEFEQRCGATISLARRTAPGFRAAS